MGANFNIIFAKKKLKANVAKKLVILEKDNTSVTFEKSDMMKIFNLTTLMEYRLERLNHLKFYQFYNNCLEYIKEQKTSNKDAGSLKDILLPALKPQLVETEILAEGEVAKTFNSIYYETTGTMHEIINFHYDYLLEHFTD